jgi:hypothetical protein
VRDPITWIIIFAVYAPFHYLGPILVAVLTGTEDDIQRRRLLRSVVIDCSVSIAFAMGIAIWLVDTHLVEAMLVLFLATLAPYTYIWFRRRRLGIAWFRDDLD